MIKNFILFIVLSTTTYSQGFDWQVNARLPFELPKSYYGLAINFSEINSTGKFDFTEEFVSCCQFEKSTQQNIQLGLAFEQWLNIQEAVSASINFKPLSNKFQTKSFIPRKDKAELITLYTFDEEINSISLDFKYKRRLYEKFSASAKVENIFIISNENTYLEEILNEGIYFKDGSKSRIIGKGQTPDLNFYNLMLSLGLSYDIPITYPYYAVISSQFSLPITKLSGNRKFWSIGIGLELFYSFEK